MKNYSIYTFTFVASLLVSLFSLTAVYAATISGGFATEEDLVFGTVVSLHPDDDTKVVKANSNDIEGLLGVVAPPTHSTLSVTSSETNVHVLTNGLTKVVISDLAGAVKKGDYITASPIDGVAQKATKEDKVLGRARENFDSSDDTAIKRNFEFTVEDQRFDFNNVALGSINAYVEVRDNPLIQRDTGLNAVLQRIGESLGSRGISPIRLMISSIILLTTLGFTTVLLYGSVKNSLISLGRNPLSQGSIYKGLMQVVGIALAIFAGALAAVYLILR